MKFTMKNIKNKVFLFSFKLNVTHFIICGKCVVYFTYEDNPQWIKCYIFIEIIATRTKKTKKKKWYKNMNSRKLYPAKHT